jgi:hypothetical protein
MITPSGRERLPLHCGTVALMEPIVLFGIRFT